MSTKIEYADETWNPFAGCLPCSPGCDNCYAARAACGRFLEGHPLYEDLAVNGKWTGEIRTCLDIDRQDILEKPLRWKKPRTIFVGNMGDLFHPKVPFEFIDKVLEMGWKAPQHTYLLLTKRIERALEYVNRHIYREPRQNTYWGATICNQAEADEKIPTLLQIPAAKRWLSIEPMLGPVDIKKYVWLRQKCIGKKGCGFTGASYEFNNTKKEGAYKCPQCGKNHSYLVTDSIDWVVVGCESGPNRRPCKVEWMIEVVEQCKAAGVKVFVKQVNINGKVSHDTNEWPEKLRG